MDEPDEPVDLIREPFLNLLEPDLSEEEANPAAPVRAAMPVLRSRLLGDLRLHPELRELTLELTRYIADLGICIDDITPVKEKVIPTLPCGTVIGNWPMFLLATKEERNMVPTAEYLDLALDDPALVTIQSLTSLVSKGQSDRLLEGLIFRRLRDYEERTVDLRPGRADDQAHRRVYGRSYRQHLQKVLCERLGRGVRDLQRFAAVLDLPIEWLRLQREGAISFSVLERIAGLSPADRDDLTAELQAGEDVQGLIEDYGLKVLRIHRRAANALEAFIRLLTKGLADLGGRLGEICDLNHSEHDVLRLAKELIEKLLCKPIRPSLAA